jgi:glutathione S-transferase
MIELHYYPSTAAMVPHIVLEEIGIPYRRVLVDRLADAHRRPEYLRLNPNGLIPVLTDGDTVLYETGAIVLHLCDAHPGAQLAPAPGTTGRAHFYKWMFWTANTLHAALAVYFYPHRWMDDGNDAGAAELKRHAELKISGLLDQLEGHLASHRGPWFMGDDYTALDAYVFTLCRWTRNFETQAPARTREWLGGYLRRMLGRPAVQRVMANEQITAPFV